MIDLARGPGTRSHRSSAATIVGRYAALIALGVGLSLFELVTWTYRSTGNANLIPSLLLLGSLTVPVAFSILIRGLNARRQVSAVLLASVAALGGVVGVITAALLEYDTLRRLGALSLLAVAVIEESAKLLGPAVAILVLTRIRPAAGLVLGVASGAGFAALETLGYSAVALVRSHENLAAVDALLLHRGMFSPATHMAWTGLTAAALCSAARCHWTARSTASLLAAFLTAVALHATWDATDTGLGYIALATISLTLLTLTARRSTRSTSAQQIEVQIEEVAGAQRGA